MTENNFRLYRSTDGGANWTDQGGTLSAVNNTVTKTGIASFSRWTVADSSLPLKDTPAITFGAAPAPAYLGGDFTVSASTTNTDSSVLTYSRVSGPCAWVSGATFSSTGAGSCVVQASGAATANFNAATQNFTVTIAKAPATLNLSNLVQAIDGTPKSVTAVTSPVGLTVEITYNGSATPPSALGSYDVVATIVETNYQGSASASLVIAPTLGVTAVVVDPAAPGTLYAAQDGAGIWKSTNGGSTWTAAATQPANQRVKGLVIKPGDNTKLFAATYGGGVYASVNSGADWTVCTNNGLSGAGLNAVSLAIDPSGTLYAGTEAGIFTSADCGTWSAVNTGLTVNATTPPVSIAIDPVTPATLYAGLDGAGIWKSVNSGGSWMAASTQPTNLRVKALVIRPGDSTRLYAATYGGGVFASTDSGDHWSACATQPTNLNALSLSIDGSGKLYAGTEAGVFVTSDGCATWSAMSNGLP